MLPVNFLRQLISFYGDSLQGLLPSYLDMSMDAFSKNQDEMRTRFGGSLGSPLLHFEEATKRNMALFDQAMSMFNPFAVLQDGAPSAGEAPTPRPAAAEPEKPKAASTPGDIEQMKDQLDAMQRQLEKMMKPKG